MDVTMDNDRVKKPRRERHCGTPRRDRAVIDISDHAPLAVGNLFRKHYERERDGAWWIDIGGEGP